MMTVLSRCSSEYVAEIIAEDIIELFEHGKFEISQLPISSNIIIDVLPQNTLSSLAIYLNKHIYHLNIPMGFFLLFLMPRRIPDKIKKSMFKDIVVELCNLREDFSLKRTVRIKKLNHNINTNWKEIEIREYRKLVFFLENLNELRIPIFRGLGLDLFVWDDYLYRAYNIGTLKKPLWIYFKAKVREPPELNVFGHLIKSEKVERVWISENFDKSKIIKLLKAEQANAAYLNTFEEKILFVLTQWEKFLEVKIKKDFKKAVSSKVRTTKSDKLFRERLKAGTKKYILKILDTA